MNNCEIKSPPVFSQEIPKWDRNTYADGNAMGAVVEQLFNNTVYNKEELKEKVDTEGGDISETQVSVLDESTEAFPVPMSGDKAKGLWGKLKKWQQDCLAKFGNYVLTSMITNQHVNSTSNIPSSALVYLMQQGVTQLNRDLEAVNEKTSKISAFNQIGVINAFNNASLGISFSFSYLGSNRSIPIIATSGNDIFNVVCSGFDTSNQRITNLSIDYRNAPWRLMVEFYIDGKIYTKYINLTDL